MPQELEELKSLRERLKVLASNVLKFETLGLVDIGVTYSGTINTIPSFIYPLEEPLING